MNKVMPVLGCFWRRVYLEAIERGDRITILDPCLFCEMRADHFKITVYFKGDPKA